MIKNLIEKIKELKNYEYDFVCCCKICKFLRFIKSTKKEKNKILKILKNKIKI